MYLLPKFGNTTLRKLTTLRLQAYFNSLQPGLSPKTIRLIHGSLRAALNQAIIKQLGLAKEVDFRSFRTHARQPDAAYGRSPGGGP